MEILNSEMAVSKYSGDANGFQRSLNVLFLKQQSNQRNEVLGLFLFFIHVFHTFRWMAQAIAEKKKNSSERHANRQ